MYIKKESKDIFKKFFEACVKTGESYYVEIKDQATIVIAYCKDYAEAMLIQIKNNISDSLNGFRTISKEYGYSVINTIKVNLNIDNVLMLIKSIFNSGGVYIEYSEIEIIDYAYATEPVITYALIALIIAALSASRALLPEGGLGFVF